MIDKEQAVELGTPFVIMAGWADVPHITEEMKAEFRKITPPNMLPAREHGIPYLGAGAIYPIPIEHLLEDSFPVPDFWPRVYGLDVGWKRTAALWVAIDRDADVFHLYDEHYAGQIEPIIHAGAIMGNGTNNMRARWIPGLIDPGARGRNQKDGSRLMKVYQDLGLDLEIAMNGVEAGITEAWQRMSTGRLKVFRHLTNFKKEYCLYRRNDNGQVVKKNDHLLDALKFICLSGAARAKPVPSKHEMRPHDYGVALSGNSWMGA